MTELGDSIRQARAKANMSQAHLAAASGLSERTVKRAEAGEPMSAETMRALSAALDTSFEPPVPDQRAKACYADLVPSPEPVHVEGRTGLLDLGDDPVRAGVAHGVLAGLSLPGTCRPADGFLADYGPDVMLFAEAQTAAAHRQRVQWIDRALRKATDPADRRRIEALAIEARFLVLEAERADAEALAVRHTWRAAFGDASLAARIVARVAQVVACLALACLAPSTMGAIALAGACFLGTSVMATVGIVLRYDRGAAGAIRRRLLDESSYRTRKEILAVHASGLTP